MFPCLMLLQGCALLSLRYDRTLSQRGKVRQALRDQNHHGAVRLSRLPPLLSGRQTRKSHGHQWEPDHHLHDQQPYQFSPEAVLLDPLTSLSRVLLDKARWRGEIHRQQAGPAWQDIEILSQRCCLQRFFITWESTLEVLMQEEIRLAPDLSPTGPGSPKQKRSVSL